MYLKHRSPPSMNFSYFHTHCLLIPSHTNLRFLLFIFSYFPINSSLYWQTNIGNRVFSECGLPTRGHIIKKSDFSQELQNANSSPASGGISCLRLPLNAGILFDYGLHKTCECCHSCCGFSYVSTPLCLEYTVTLMLPTTSGSYYSLFGSFSIKILEECDPNVLFKSWYSTVFYSLHTTHMGVPLLSAICIEKMFLLQKSGDVLIYGYNILNDFSWGLHFSLLPS